MRNTQKGTQAGQAFARRALALLACLLWFDTAAAVPASGLPTHASGVFINAGGDLLTALHAVAECDVLYAVKDTQVLRAEVIARDALLDLAVLSTGFKPYLSAVFPATSGKSRSQPVFAEAYSVLQNLPNRAATLFNAMATPGQDELSMISGVRPGASGSGVLGAAGLVLGVVVERVATDRNPDATVPLSRAHRVGASGATHVKAVSAERIKQFLRASNIAYTQSDTPQLGPMQPQAPRAATLSAGVICG